MCVAGFFCVKNVLIQQYYQNCRIFYFICCFQALVLCCFFVLSRDYLISIPEMKYKQTKNHNNNTKKNHDMSFFFFHSFDMRHIRQFCARCRILHSFRSFAFQLRFRKHGISNSSYSYVYSLHTWVDDDDAGAHINSRTRTLFCKYLLSALFVAWEKCRYENYTIQNQEFEVQNRTGCHMAAAATALPLLYEPTESRFKDLTHQL